MDDILGGLNAAQLAAVKSDAAILQVLAPPGSGKTKTLTARVANLIASSNIKPWNIIVCTFTVKAAREMSERIKTYVGHDSAKKLQLGTFHSISLRYLRQYGQHIGLTKQFGIADTSDSKAIVARIIKKHDFGIAPGAARSRISSQKAKGIDSEQFRATAKGVEQQEFAQIFSEYDDTLRASDLLDYDDLLLRCCFLLRTHPQCVSNIEAVLIDEFQDTNNIQYELMGLFASRRNVITIVGDPDQSIYGFRSAEIKNLHRMKQQWPDTLTINLEQNYRSSGAILHAAQKVIEQDESRPPKKLQATHTFGLRPVLRKLPSAWAEAEWLVGEVKRVRALTGNMLELSDFAILLRSASLSRVIESALGKAGLSYRMVGGTRFYDRAEVKLLIDYLRAMNQPENGEVIERVINVPSRKIGDASLKALREEAAAHSRSLWDVILDITQGRRQVKAKLSDATKKGLSSFVGVILSGIKKINSAEESATLLDVMNLILKKLDFQNYLKQKYPDDDEARWANVEELMALAADASDPDKLKALMEADLLPSIEGLEQRTPDSLGDSLTVFLANIALASSTDEKAEGEKVQQLTISTVHAAKGLEWPVVFIPACYDGSIPHSRADDNDEERRLLYVGMTRAQATLYLSCPIRNTQREETSLSTFLTQPGVTPFFEEHGPTIPYSVLPALSTTLNRDCPTVPVVIERKRGLECEEDNYWPLNGEQPISGSSRWYDNGNEASAPSFGLMRPVAVFSSEAVTMQGFTIASALPKMGFVSAQARFEELKEESTLKKVDKRADDKAKSKKPGEGKGNIASFFSRPKQKAQDPDEPTPTIVPSKRDASHDFKEQRRPLQEIPNPLVSGRHAATHKPQTAPLFERRPDSQSQDAGSGRGYVFLSSSPAKPEHQEDTSTASKPPPTETRPATTFHTTSMQRVGSQRRTLGVRRSLNGWSARGGKS